MFFKRLSLAGIPGVEEWRNMWNDEIVPHLKSLQPVAGPGIMIDRHPNGTVIRAVPAPGVAAASPPAGESYSSYFKLTLAASDENGVTVHRVTIADGATGGNSVAVVNGYSTYTVPPYTETVSGDRLFFLKYRPAVYGPYGAVVTPATLTIDSIGADGAGALVLPDGGTDNAFYTQLGRVLWHDGSPETVQDFTAGTADVRWYFKY